MIRDATHVPQGFEEHTDVCVIGSGAGGGVTAGVLAEAGREVLLLEEGAHVPPPEKNQREAQMYPRLYRDGGNQVTDDGGISVLQGRTLGGSTVVNMADVVPIPEEVLAHWSARYGVDRYTVEQVRRADAVCSEAMGSQAIDADLVNLNNELLLRGARAIGLDGGVFHHNRVGCIGAGFCLIGCAYEAKRSVALTWIPRAIATTRCLVQTEARVERLARDGSRVVAAVGSIIDVRDNRPIAPFRVTANHFVLSAGAIHTPLILMRSSLTRPVTRVGRWLSLQPQIPVAAVFPQEVVPWRGVPQSAFVDSEETATQAHGLGGYRLEGVSATPGMSAVSVSAPVAQIHSFMESYRRSTACLCLVPDQPTGQVSLGPHGRPMISYTLSPEVELTLRRAVRSASLAYLKAGAEVVLLPFSDAEPVTRPDQLDQLAWLRVRPNASPLISAHPQGTCRMGPHPSTSVVGPDLRVHGVENLSIADASIFPTTSSSHTMLPVMSFAWLAAQELSTR